MDGLSSGGGGGRIDLNMAETIKVIGGELVFEPNREAECPGCRWKDKLCNRFGSNGFRVVNLVGIRPEEAGCDVKTNLIEVRSNIGL